MNLTRTLGRLVSSWGRGAVVLGPTRANGHRLRSVGTGFVLWALLIGCRPAPGVSPEVAQVGSAVLTEAEMAALPPSFGPAERRRYVARWVETQLLAQAALKAGLDDDSAYVVALRRAKRDLLAAASVERLYRTEPVATPSSAEIERYYRQHGDSFLLSEDAIRFEHLVTDSLGKALNARRAAIQGDSWDSLVARYSSNPALSLANPRWHPLREVLPGVPTVVRYLERLDSGQVSPPIRTELGLHLVRLTGRRRAGQVADLPSVRDEIVMQLQLAERNQRYTDYLNRLRREIDVTVVDSNIAR